MRVDLFDENGDMRKYADVMEDVRRAYFEELMRDRPSLKEAAERAGLSVETLRRRLRYTRTIACGVHYKGARV